MTTILSPQTHEALAREVMRAWDRLCEKTSTEELVVMMQEVVPLRDQTDINETDRAALHDLVAETLLDAELNVGRAASETILLDAAVAIRHAHSRLLREQLHHFVTQRGTPQHDRPDQNKPITDRKNQ